MIQIKVNEYQTPITEQLLEIYPEEVRNQFEDMVTNIPLISWLISDKRPRAKDLPRDEYGRIIVDITHPHILEDMDYFRQPAIHFLEHGCYTFLRPDGNPKSPYKKFWLEEMRRCRDGYVRESDGEWIPGQLYFFLNYVQILVTVIEEGKKKARKMTTFPHIWEGLYLRFHYLYQARENGSHAIELAKRGAHPYFQKVFTPDGWKNWGDIKIGDSLYASNNTVCKVTSIPFDKEAPYYRITLRDRREIYATDDHLWNIIKKGEEITVNTAWLLQNYKHNRKKSYRIPSGIEHNCFIRKNDGIEMPYRITNVEPYTFGLLLGDGCFRVSSCSYTQSSIDMEIEKQFIPYNIIKWQKKYEYKIDIPNWNSIKKEYGLNVKSEDKFIPDEYKYNSKEVRLKLLKGLLDSDGYIHGGVPVLTSTSKKLIDDVSFIARSLGYNTNFVKKKAGYKKDGIYRQCLDSYELTIYAGPEVFNLPRKQVKVKYNSGNAKSRRDRTCIINIEYVGTAPCKCVTVDSEDNCYLIGDFVKTHNCGKSLSLSSIMAHNLLLGEDTLSKQGITTILTAHAKEYLGDKDGTLLKFTNAINFVWKNTPFPHKLLKSSMSDYTWIMGYKDPITDAEMGSRNQVLGVSAQQDADKLRGKRGWILFEEIGSFPALISLYDTTRRSVEDGSYTFALMYLVGTSSQKDSNFASAKTLLYKTKSYNIYTLENVYDKSSQGKETFGYFFPSYMNRTGCYNKDGVSDVVKGLLEILSARYTSREADPASILSVIAEDPITPAEAMIKVQDNFFPVAQLSERANQLDSDPKAYDDIYVGNLVFSKGKQLEFKPTEDIPLRKWRLDLQDSKQGALEIYAMPEKSPNGEIIFDRYIVGHDPVDNDSSETTSLSSTFVFDMFTDTIVAEFTGRLPFADDNYEIVRKLCLFYNAKCLYESNLKGLFGYFQRYNCLYLLAETPAHLRDQHYIKYTNFGNSKYGVRANASINNYANRLLRDWLLKPMNVISEEGEITVPTLMTIRNRALIDELINFNPIVNVDRIRAMGMVMLLRQELIVQYQGEVRHEEEIGEDLANDEFFKKNYDDRFGLSEKDLTD